MTHLVHLALAASLAASPAGRTQAPGDSTNVPVLDDTRAQRLFSQLMSPYCPGLTVASCPSPGADSLRNDIRGRLARGDAPADIREWYVSAWGEQVLGAPPARRLGLVLWVLPGVAFAAGAAGLSLWLARVRRRAAEAEAEVAGHGKVPSEPALLARLEQELRDFGRDG